MPKSREPEKDGGRAVMPELVKGRIHIQCSGLADAPPLVMHHALGASLEMWQPQLQDLEPHFRVIRIDMRGHGKSPALPPPYSLEDLADDVAVVLDHLEIERTDYLGLSIGGMVGQAMAIHHGNRIGRLVLANTTSHIPAEAHAMWDGRIEKVRQAGMESQVQPTLDRWFTPEFAKDNPDRLAWIAGMVRQAAADGFIGCCQAIRQLDFTALLSGVPHPCLVISGGRDAGTPPEKGRILADALPAGRFELMPDVSHLSNVADPEGFNQLVLSFLRGQGS